MGILRSLAGGGSFWWIAGGIGLLLAAIGVQQLRVVDVQRDLAIEQRDRKDERVRLVQAGLDAVAAARAEESRRAAAHLEATRAAEKALSQARADGAAADAAAGGLRARAAALAARCDRRPEDPATAQPSEAARAPGELFVDVLGRLEKRGRELAAYADSARIAGEACVRAYEALTIPPGPAVPGAE